MDERNDYICCSLSQSCYVHEWNLKSGGYMKRIFGSKTDINGNKPRNNGHFACDNPVRNSMYLSGGKDLMICSGNGVYIYNFDIYSENAIERLIIRPPNQLGFETLDIVASRKEIKYCWCTKNNMLALAIEYGNEQDDDLDSEIHVYDDNGNYVKGFICNSGSLEMCKLSDDSRYVMTSTEDGVEFWDFDDHLENAIDLDQDIMCYNFSNCSEKVVCGLYDGIISVYKCEKETNSSVIIELFRIESHMDIVYDCIFFEDNNRILSSSLDGSVNIINMENNIIEKHIDIVSSLSNNRVFSRTFHRAFPKDITSRVKSLFIDKGLIEESNFEELNLIDESLSQSVSAYLYEDYDNIEFCRLTPDEKNIVIVVNNGAIGTEADDELFSIICLLDFEGNIKQIINEFPVPEKIWSIDIKPINYEMKRSRSSNLLLEMVQSEDQKILSNLKSMIKSTKDNDLQEILTNTLNTLKDKLDKRSTSPVLEDRPRPGTPIEMIFTDPAKKDELVNFLYSDPNPAKRSRLEGGVNGLYNITKHSGGKKRMYKIKGFY